MNIIENINNQSYSYCNPYYVVEIEYVSYNIKEFHITISYKQSRHYLTTIATRYTVHQINCMILM